MDALTKIWEGGEHSFALRMRDLRALQEKCDAGPEHIMNRIRTGEWEVDDVYETIRLGLIGGGMAVDEANTLCRKVFERCHILRDGLKLDALAILMFSLLGPPDDQPEKPAGEETEEKEPTPEESGNSPSSSG